MRKRSTRRTVDLLERYRNKSFWIWVNRQNSINMASAFEEKGRGEQRINPLFDDHASFQFKFLNK